MGYIIVPKNLTIKIDDANTADEAMIKFATNMSSDMNDYFVAISEETATNHIVNLLPTEIISKAHDMHVIAFMKNELLTQFDLNEDETDEVSKDAYEIYCRGDGQTEYECIEEAYNNFIDNRKG